TPGHARSAQVEMARERLFDRACDERGDVAGVNDLNVVRTIARSEHAWTLRGASDPVGEAIIRIPRTCDDLRAQEGATIAEDFLDDIFAGHFERAVGRTIDVD